MKLGRRDAFPEVAARAYLNHAAVSPCSLRVREAVDRSLAAYARDGVAALVAAAEQRKRLKKRLAELIGAESDGDIAFVPSTTRGVTDVAICFPWQSAGPRVLVSEGEFPANVTPWQRAAAMYDLEIAFLPQPHPETFESIWWPAFIEALDEGAALVAVSAVQFQTGFRMPLRRIGEACRDYRAQLFVDAIQAAGVVPLDVRAAGIDYLACGSHKWLMGLEGTAFVYVAPERVGALSPHVAGWLSHEDPLSFLSEGPGRLSYDRPIRSEISFLEGGSTNALGYVALEAALVPLLQIGIEAIFDHVTRYLDRLEEGLVARGFTSMRSKKSSERSGILSVLPPSGVDVIALFRAIDPAEVACSTPDGHLRFAPHWPNDPAEVDGVLAAIDAAMARL